MEYGKTELIRLLRNVMREGWSDQKIKDLVDSLWRDKYPGADEVIYGGVIWDGDLNFTGTRAKFRINNRLYNAPQTPFPLDAADATYTRIDIVTLNTDGEWEVIKGTPSAYPMPSSDYDRDTNLFVTPITIPAGATQPANMVEGQIYNEHIAGEWTPSVVGTTADWDNTVGPSIGAKCAAVGALSNGDMIVFTAPEDYTDTDWATLSFDLQLPDTNSKGHFIEVYFTYNGNARSNLLYATFSRTNVNWQKVVFAIPDFAIRNALFNGLVLRWFNRSGATYAGIKIDNVRLQKGIELPEQTDNYTTGASWDEATGTLTLHRTGALGDIAVNLAGIDGVDGYTPVKGVDYFDGDDGAPGAPGSPGTSSYTYVAYASDNAGTGWSLTPTDLLKYRAEIHRTSPLSPPVAGDFTGATWVKYIGDDGTGGGVTQVTGLTLLAANWVADASLFKYVLSNAAITADHIVEVVPDNSAYDVLVVAKPLQGTTSVAGEVTMWVHAIPSADITVTLNLYTKTT